MQLHNGTSILDWKHYEKKAKAMTDAQLLFSIRDCQQAVDAAPEEANFPCKAQGFYLDEMYTYSDELRRRRQAV